MSAHVVVDVRLGRWSGHRTYIRNLLPRLAVLAPEWRWSLLGDREWLEKEAWARFANADILPCGAPVYGVREQLELPLRIPGTADLYWATHYNIPLWSRTPLVLTVHDLAHLRLPEYTRSLAKRAYARLMFSVARRRARGAICVSEFTRRELVELVGDFAGSATVVHNGVDASWFELGRSTRSSVASPYFLFVGNLKPHKNLGVLLDAFSMIGEVRETLVVVGKDEGLRTSDHAALQRLSASQRVVVAGEVDDAELRRLVADATALVFPSLYEGFGLPALEAMAAGCPVIASQAASMPEVCGNGALYFEPTDARQLADSLLHVSKDARLRADLRERGAAQAKKFSWDASAKQTLAVLQRALGRQ